MPSAVRGSGSRLGRALTALAAASALTLALAVPAAADYQQVGHFGQGGEAEQLQFATAIAVNASGAGGVAAGSFYVVGRNARVLRFGPGSEGEEPPFEEAWGWGVADGAGEFQRCGPAVAIHPTCTAVEPNAPFGGEEVGHFNTPAGVAVDQATGDVYVLNTSTVGHREHHLVEVFSATGAPVGEGFGDAGRRSPSPAESIAEGPEKLHEMGATVSAIAVDGAGKVYVTDYDYSNIASPPGEARVMCFSPQSPGDYEHYAYCGRSEDIRLGAPGARFIRIGLDEAGELSGAGEAAIKAYALSEKASPACRYEVVGGGLQAMAVNPLSGEVFYFNQKDGKAHRLGPCDAGTGEFGEVHQEAVPAEPKTEGMVALAVSPARSWGPERPAGILYGADGENHEGEIPPHHGIGDVFALAAVHAPAIEAESAAGTGTASSTLEAKIDPHGFETGFSFQYLSASEYEEAGESFAGAAEAPLGGGKLGGGSEATAAATVSGLLPETEYAFRAIATSDCEEGGEPCVTTGAPAFFRTYPLTAAGLPDHRAFELVSPAEKNGGQVFPAEPGFASCAECKPPGGGGANVGGRFPMQSTPEGNGVAYEGYPFSASGGSAVFNAYLSRRTASGWQTTALSPPLQATKDLGSVAFDSQLSQGLISQKKPQLSPAAPPGYANLYIQASTAEPRSLSPLLTVAPPHRTEAGFEIKYGGHSGDFSCQLLAANDSLTGPTAFAPEPPDPGPTGRDLYEWRAGALRLVNVLPGNAAVATAPGFASASPDAHAVSTDCSRIYWEDGSGQLYVREDGEVSREIPGTSPSVGFLTASADGSEVLLSNGCLYDLQAESCADLTEGEGGFSGILGAGEEGEEITRLYFVDTAKLPGAGKNEAEEEPQPGKDNLYAWHEGALAFIATLLPQDNAGGGSRESPADWAADPSQRTAEASPAGRYLAFLSKAPLTGYENVGPRCEFTSVEGARSAPCAEVFLYDSAAGRLRCASCNPTGEAPLGRSTLRRIEESPEWLPQPRYLTDSGRLFFDSSDRLSPLDSNGGVEDVYEFEPQGLGTCSRPAGCVSLISPGTGASDSNLLAVDESGANVFFTTRDRLLGADRDELIDLYDAREGGGFAGEGEASPRECSGEACQPQVPVPPLATPGSASFEGPGNVVEKPRHKKKHREKHKRKAHRQRHGGRK